MAGAKERPHPTPESQTSSISGARKEKGANPLGRIDLRRMRRMRIAPTIDAPEPTEISILRGGLPKVVGRRYGMEIKIVATVPGDALALSRAIEAREDIDTDSSPIADEQQKGK